MTFALSPDESQAPLYDQGIKDSVLDLIGNTSMVRLSRLKGAQRARLIAKLKGYRLVCTVPDGMSPEKINLLKAYGVKVILRLSDVVQYHLRT